MNLLLKIFGYVLYSIWIFPSEFRHWVKVRLLQLHKQIVMHSPFVTNTLGKYAIFAIYPGTTTKKSCLRMIDALIVSGFTVIIVFNRNSEVNSWISEFESQGCTILLRPNIGRDFGAYQAGLSFLLKKTGSQGIERLVFVNDTCYVSPKCKEIFLDTFFAQEEFNCVLKHSQGVIHGSSSLLNLSTRNLELPTFFDFWRRYYPSNNRIRVVFRGEHELSEVIGQAHLFPATDAIFNHEHVLTRPEAVQLRIWIQRSNPNLYEIFYNSFKSYDDNPDTHNIRFALENLQVSNSLGLYLARKYAFPLKLDLPYYLLTTKVDLIEVLSGNGCDEDELLEVQKILDYKQNISVGNSFTRTLRDLGIPV